MQLKTPIGYVPATSQEIAEHCLRTHLESAAPPTNPEKALYVGWRSDAGIEYILKFSSTSALKTTISSTTPKRNPVQTGWTLDLYATQKTGKIKLLPCHYWLTPNTIRVQRLRSSIKPGRSETFAEWLNPEGDFSFSKYSISEPARITYDVIYDSEYRTEITCYLLRSATTPEQIENLWSSKLIDAFSHIVAFFGETMILSEISDDDLQEIKNAFFDPNRDFSITRHTEKEVYQSSCALARWQWANPKKWKGSPDHQYELAQYQD